MDGSESPSGVRRDRVHASSLLWDALNIPRAQQRQDHSSRMKMLMTQRLGWVFRRQLRIGDKNSMGFLRVHDIKESGNEEE